MKKILVHEEDGFSLTVSCECDPSSLMREHVESLSLWLAANSEDEFSDHLEESLESALLCMLRRDILR